MEAGDQSASGPAPDDIDEAIAEILDAAESEPVEPKSETEQLKDLIAERTLDLQRLHAEYANYKKRVDRDRLLSRAAGIEAVVLDLLPVLDGVEAAREHSELVGGFKLVAEELEKITSKYGLEVFGEVGEPFDPQIHEALMQMPMAGDFEVATVSAVMQRGVRLNDRVIRPARVGVADPDGSAE
jgi:molecular chaperone GrpE